jgi:hypothetical protein
MQLKHVVIDRELSARTMLDVSDGQAGARWTFHFAFPIGSVPLYFRFAGDHFFGSPAGLPLRTVFTFGTSRASMIATQSHA